MAPAIAFYLAYPAGLTLLAVAPALRAGDWSTALINGAMLGALAYGTYDLTMKAVVSGAVNWPHRFVMSVTGSDRVFATNDLPDHPSGVFPVGVGHCSQK